MGCSPRVTPAGKAPERWLRRGTNPSRPPDPQPPGGTHYLKPATGKRSGFSFSGERSLGASILDPDLRLLGSRFERFLRLRQIGRALHRIGQERRGLVALLVFGHLSSSSPAASMELTCRIFAGQNKNSRPWK